MRAPHVLHWQAYSLSRLVNLCLAVYYCSIFWRHADDQAWVEMMAWFRVSAMAGIAAYGVVLFSLPTWLIPDALGMLATGLSLLNSASGLLNMVRFVVGTAVVPSLCWCVMSDCAQAAIARRKDASEIPLAFNVMNLFTSYVPRVFLCALRNSPRLPQVCVDVVCACNLGQLPHRSKRGRCRAGDPLPAAEVHVAWR